jgi:hypothetical protein
VGAGFPRAHKNHYKSATPCCVKQRLTGELLHEARQTPTNPSMKS